MILKFPQPWYESIEQERPVSQVQQIEVRKILNSTDGEFFFAALPNGAFDYIHEWQPNIPKPEYSENSFAVNLTAPPRVRIGTKQEWESASRIWTTSHLVFSKTSEDPAGELEYHGKKFKFAGKYCDGGELSPFGRWLALFSYTGEKTEPDLLFGSGDPKVGDVYWQIYDTLTREKVFESHTKNVKYPTSLRGPVVWLEERYFLFPQDRDSQNFSVVTLPEFVPETNPSTIQLSSRKDDRGQRIPAPVNNEAWTPLVPLTPEQAKKITAPQPVTLLEVRRQTASRRLLFAIREETANEKRYRGGKGREEGGDYNYRLFCTYYYAISPDDPTQTRFASKEEWESAGRLTVRSGLDSIDKTYDTTDGPRRTYRPFLRRGAVGDNTLVLSTNWNAVFSYTPDAGSRTSGTMFVEIVETRSGNHLLTKALPYSGSPMPLFEKALAIEGEYLLLPLNTSLESFALWKLP